MTNDMIQYQRDPSTSYQGLGGTSELLEPALNPALCFLCGKRVAEAKQFNEPIFPKWMLDEYDLWQQEMTLPDQSTITYGDLKITSCHRCHKIVGDLDQEVKKAVLVGPDAVRAMDQERLFLWVAKLYHGLFFHDIQYLLNPMNPLYQVVPHKDVARGYAVNYMLLKRLVGHVEWSDFPASIFVFEALTGDNPKANFDFFDMVERPALAIRCGSSYIVAVLQDFGTVANYDGLEQWQQIAVADRLKLHPEQCLELFAVFHTVVDYHRPPRLKIETDDQGFVVTVLAPGDMDGAPPVSPHLDPFYERTLREMFRHRYDIEIVSGCKHIYHDHCVPTLFVDGDGEPLQALSIDADITG